MQRKTSLHAGLGSGRLSPAHTHALFRSLAHRTKLDADDRALLESVFTGAEHIGARKLVLRQGQVVCQSILVTEGMLCRYRDFPNGARQIIAVYLPGDFVDLPSFALPVIDQDIMTLSRCSVALAPHERIDHAISQCPGIGRSLWLLTNLDGAINREWGLSLGQRRAVERAAHLFCELHIRLELVGLADEGRFSLPMTQVDIAQCLALSPVHTNRVLRELRERKLMQIVRGKVTIEDWDGLRNLAGFDPTYLQIAPVRT